MALRKPAVTPSLAHSLLLSSGRCSLRHIASRPAEHDVGAAKHARPVLPGHAVKPEASLMFLCATCSHLANFMPHTTRRVPAGSRVLRRVTGC